MTRSKWKTLLVIFITAFALWKAYPPLDIYDSKGNLVQKGKVNLGLDLQGGTYLILEVDTSKLSKEEKKDATDRALGIIRNRIDLFGVMEPSIQKQSENRIVVQLPGITDRERAIELVKRTAHLEFILVSDDPDLLKKAIDGEQVPGYVLKYSNNEPLLVEDKPSLTGDKLVDATVEFSQQQFGQPYVSITFNSEGGAIFSELTAKNVNRRLAIALDGNVQSAPVIREKIPSGRAQITGSFSVDEANDLAIVLRAGALPAPVNILEERTVGPTLGKYSIQRGITATLIGGAAVVIFMLIYYLICGLIADIALLLNFVFIVAALAYFNATLTLPGIAGLVLTLGMAVDANVLIYERIREESKLDKPLRAAISAGYNKAFLTIFDSNLTTIIAAILLFQFGTGPIRGFATTLTIGLAASMFTAIVVTRLILDYLVANFDVSRLSMMQFIKSSNIDFIGKRRIAYAASLALIIVGMIAFAMRGTGNFGIDFTGGTVQQFSFTKPVAMDKARATLKEIGLGSSPIQQFGGNDKEILIRTFADTASVVETKFKEVFTDNPFQITRVDVVGPEVGGDLKRRAMYALFYSLIGMLIYIGFRFEFKYAFGGILALFHDVLVSVGLLALTGREISLTVIAALLTIVGYSINDTIVIFDRIRENRRLMRKADVKTIINTSLNQTLSRTILTSLTTFLVVLSLFFLGGEVINDFAFTLLVGVIAGSYSTVFIACPILIDWPGKKRL